MTQTQKLHAAIRETLVEADDVYTLMIEAGESPNIDSIGYTSQVMLDQFRHLFDRPDMSAEELEQILRSARAHVRAVIGPRAYARVPKPVQTRDVDLNWSDLMAHIVINQTNENSEGDDNDNLPLLNRQMG